MIAALPPRFLAKVIRRPDESGCWDWTGVTVRGYGQFHSDRRTVLAHRFALARHEGKEIPPTAEVLHSCDRPCCVNPAHLSWGSRLDNSRDMVAKGRSAKGVRHGMAKLTEDDIRAIRKDVRSLRKVGRDYGIGPGQVWRIRNHAAWSHV